MMKSVTRKKILLLMVRGEYNHSNAKRYTVLFDLKCVFCVH